MKTISKQFKSSSQASVYQDKLYGKYDNVQLVTFPRFSEGGVYVWSVK